MIEPIMFVGIGFLVAGLLVIGIIPLVHARAVRLTMKRLEALTPLSMAEIQADKDQLRAEFAMSTRRLEMSVEQLKAKTTSQLTEIGKKSEAIGRLKLELGEKTAQLLALEAKEKQLNEELYGFQSDYTSKGNALEETERALAETRAQLEAASAGFSEHSVTVDSQRVELIALRAQTEVLKGQIEGLEQEIRAHQERFQRETTQLTQRLTHKTEEAEAAARALDEERNRSDLLGSRVSELERQLLAQTTESEVLGRRAQELSGRLDEQSRFLADREFVSDRFKGEAEMAQKTEAEVRAELADAESRHRFATESLRAEKALIEQQLTQSQEERAKLQREIAGMKREAENAWANERMENAVLRERINDVAAEVARLTATLEGPDSPIDAIVNSAHAAGAGAHAANGSVERTMPSIAPGAGESKGTLADRIRALQSRASAASGVPQPSRA
jgi:chromosome segregation ATPase